MEVAISPKPDFSLCPFNTLHTPRPSFSKRDHNKPLGFIVFLLLISVCGTSLARGSTCILFINKAFQ